MSKHSVSNSSPKLNLTDRQLALFQKIILVGNSMSDALSTMDRRKMLPKAFSKLIRKWQDLMVQLVQMLI